MKGLQAGRREHIVKQVLWLTITRVARLSWGTCAPSDGSRSQAEEVSLDVLSTLFNLTWGHDFGRNESIITRYKMGKSRSNNYIIHFETHSGTQTFCVLYSPYIGRFSLIFEEIHIRHWFSPYFCLNKVVVVFCILQVYPWDKFLSVELLGQSYVHLKCCYIRLHCRQRGCTGLDTQQQCMGPHFSLGIL